MDEADIVFITDDCRNIRLLNMYVLRAMRQIIGILFLIIVKAIVRHVKKAKKSIEYPKELLLLRYVSSMRLLCLQTFMNRQC